MGTLDSNCWNLMKMAGREGNAHYPETLGLFFVINTPVFFRGMFGICKGFLDEKTARTIKLFGTDYLPALREAIDDD